MTMTFGMNLGQSARLCTASLALLMTTAAVSANAEAPAPTKAQAQYEVRFMTDMIDHHAMAIQMSQICLAKAVHEELRTLCQEIIVAQQQEIVTMQDWLQNWYGVSYAPEMTNGAMQRMERLSELPPEEFEVAFMKMMIRHHWKAVVRASGCLERAYHPELIAMCEEIVLAQVREIEIMRTWLCQWYGLCSYGPKGNLAETH
jgi:uncharacterized protein (DUF305 family)